MSEEDANNTLISQQSQAPPRYPRILLGITGSVAAVKGPELAVRLVKELEAEVRIVLTRGGYNFWTKAETYHPEYWREFKYLETSAVNPKQEQEERQQQQEEWKNKSMENIVDHHDEDEEEQLELLEEQPNIQVHYAEDEWADWKQLGDSILHIDLRDWADIIVIAPLSAHTLAKLAHGLCDDTLSCVMRAWDFGHHPDPQQRPGKPVVLAPAMNTAMWEHPLTESQLRTITEFWKPKERVEVNGVNVVSPQVKLLACGELGNGAMANVDDIIRVVKNALELHSRETTL